MTHIAAPAPMAPMPIDEATIESGVPTATGATLYTSPDGRTTVGMFRCTPGRFRYTLEAEEVTHLLAGNIVIQPDDGGVIDARAGDTFVLPAGQSMLVDIRETITDIYITWSPE